MLAIYELLKARSPSPHKSIILGIGLSLPNTKSDSVVDLSLISAIYSVVMRSALALSPIIALGLGAQPAMFLSPRCNYSPQTWQHQSSASISASFTTDNHHGRMRTAALSVACAHQFSECTSLFGSHPPAFPHGCVPQHTVQPWQSFGSGFYLHQSPVSGF